LSITNNIAEGSGSVSKTDFANFLIILSSEKYLAASEIEPMLRELEDESRMILGFIRHLRSKQLTAPCFLSVLGLGKPSFPLLARYTRLYT
jgi:hypothetical protein